MSESEQIQADVDAAIERISAAGREPIDFAKVGLDWEEEIRQQARDRDRWNEFLRRVSDPTDDVQPTAIVE